MIRFDKIIEFKIKEIEKKIYLMNEINNVYNNYKKYLIHYNEKNKAIFERSLLKNQLAYF